MKETTKNILAVIIGIPMIIGIYVLFIHFGLGKYTKSAALSAAQIERCKSVGYEELFDEEGGTRYSVALGMFVSRERFVKCFRTNVGKTELSDFVTLENRFSASSETSPSERRCKELGFSTAEKVYNSKTKKEINNEKLFDKDSMVICRLKSSYTFEEGVEGMSQAYPLYSK